MQQSHKLGYLPCARIVEHVLIEQSILFIVVKFKSPPLLDVQDRAEGLIDQSLRTDRLVFIKIIVQGYTVIGILVELDVLLKILDLILLVNFFE